MKLNPRRKVLADARYQLACAMEDISGKLKLDYLEIIYVLSEYTGRIIEANLRSAEEEKD